MVSFSGILEAKSFVLSSKLIRMQPNNDDTQMYCAKIFNRSKDIGSFPGTNAYSKFF
jgi:hypothetical protein